MKVSAELLAVIGIVLTCVDAIMTNFALMLGYGESNGFINFLNQYMGYGYALNLGVVLVTVSLLFFVSLTRNQYKVFRLVSWSLLYTRIALMVGVLSWNVSLVVL